MCGITGIWHLNNEKLEPGLLRHFTDSLLHRGPDGSGYKIFEPLSLGFGHRRLSILDLSERGRQPMGYGEDRYWITYNGEIYNFIELRGELLQKGYHFKTDTDTEVILAAYDCWGKDCLLKFNGMWAFAIYDNKKNELFLSRDRFGIKPLYYLFIPGKIFAFASETIAFRFLDGFNRETNENNLLHFIHHNHLMETSGYTIFNNIFQVLPGHSVLFKPGKKVEQKRWWNTLEHLLTIKETYDEQVLHFSDLFKSACLLRMRSDVPIASALSGGLDSSSVYCQIHDSMRYNNAERVPDNWQKAYVMTFPGSSNDERRYAEKVINKTNGEVKYFFPDHKNLSDNIIKSTLKFDSVTGTPILIASEIYRHMLMDGIKVSMDGHGADEMLFGYTSSIMAALRFAANSKDNDNLLVRDLSDTYINLFDNDQRESARSKIQNMLYKIENFKAQQKKKSTIEKKLRKIAKWVFNKKNNKFHVMDTDFSSDWFYSCNFSSLPDMTSVPYSINEINDEGARQLFQEFHYTSLPYILRNFDRASMQSGVEIRSPFLDYRLVTYTMSLPSSSKIGNGYTKKILRDAMKNILPDEIRCRTQKTGLHAPLSDWFNGPLSEFVLDYIHSDQFRKLPNLNTSIVKQFVNDRYNNRSWSEPDCTKVWLLINASIVTSQ